MDSFSRHLRANREHDKREKEMADAYRESLDVSPKEHARKLKAENRGLLLFLAVVLAATALVIAFY